ncbi:MAG TPA: hypothetical protein PLS23_13380 [Phycisphaerae bacterium]|nr:hypothetical protein [Phycisphaerae bacterium]
MKAIIVLLGAIGLGMAGLYFFGGYNSFDPDKQGRDAKATITPGMTWTQVVAVAGENPKLHTISIYKSKIAGRTVQQERIGPAVAFSTAKVASNLAANQYPNGFILSYMFSEQVAFNVRFDSKGVATAIEDAPTIADLLQTRQP